MNTVERKIEFDGRAAEGENNGDIQPYDLSKTLVAKYKEKLVLIESVAAVAHGQFLAILREADTQITGLKKQFNIMFELGQSENTLPVKKISITKEYCQV